jgi:hypothetical protein
MDSERGVCKTPRLRSAIFRTVHDEPLIGVSTTLVRSQSAILHADSLAFLRCLHERGTSPGPPSEEKEDVWLEARE